jgi:hypothetical protein
MDEAANAEKQGMSSAGYSFVLREDLLPALKLRYNQFYISFKWVSICAR